jgi:hypothetical protein
MVMGYTHRSAPIMWESDFLYATRTASCEDMYVLSEKSEFGVRIPEHAASETARLA